MGPRMRRELLFPLTIASGVLAAIALGGCVDGATDGAGANGSSENGGGPVGAANDLPCDVAELLETHCLACHQGSNIKGGVDLSSRASLMAESPAMPDQTVAERAVARMKDTDFPMPQAGQLPAAQIAVLEGWVAAGMPEGDCGAEPPGPIEITCTSGQFETGGEEDESDDMTPGQACIKCHSTPDDEGEIEGPRFRFAGTAYPTPHEPDNCVATGVGGAVVVVTDANGASFEATVRAGGNFFVEGTPLAMPITAEIRKNGKVLKMMDPVMSGDCNTCHTAEGAEGASGRIFPPE
jgi:hypothetical protein